MLAQRLDEFDQQNSLANRPARAAFKTPADSGRINALSLGLAKILCAEKGAVMKIEATGIWPSSENLFLVERFRRGCGVITPLREMPIHIFSPTEVDECWSMVALGFLNFWDFYVFSLDSIRGLQASHDEWLELNASNRKAIQPLLEFARHFELQPIRGKGGKGKKGTAAGKKRKRRQP